MGTEFASPKEIQTAVKDSGLSLREFFDEGNWPRIHKAGSYSGKFESGELVKVRTTGKAARERFRGWLGATGIVVAWRRTGGDYGGQSEYRIYSPTTKKSRWIWADQLVGSKD